MKFHHFNNLIADINEFIGHSKSIRNLFGIWKCIRNSFGFVFCVRNLFEISLIWIFSEKCILLNSVHTWTFVNRVIWRQRLRLSNNGCVMSLGALGTEQSTKMSRIFLGHSEFDTLPYINLGWIFQSVSYLPT